MQMAAVMAARLMAKAPNGASSNVTTPVAVITGETGMLKPAARWAATPGRFCEAMVTMNSGSATPTTLATLNCGHTKTGWAQDQSTAPSASRPCPAATAMPASSTAGTA